jgi:hypothetical protein
MHSLSRRSRGVSIPATFKRRVDEGKNRCVVSETADIA